MLFQVERTSMWNDQKPHAWCKQIELTRVHTRTVKSPEEFDARFASSEGKWLENGTNHRHDKNGWITRDDGRQKVWGIEINTLEELVNFIGSVDSEVVIGTSIVDRITPTIEIYDDYRE